MGLPICGGRGSEDGHMVAGRHSIRDDVRRGGCLCDCMAGRGAVGRGVSMYVLGRLEGGRMALKGGFGGTIWW